MKLLKEKLLIHVDGIHCSSCVQKLEALPQRDRRIASSKVYFGESLVEIETISSDSEGLISTDEVIEQIQNLGFRAQFLKDKTKTFEAHKKTNRKHLSKIAVAAFCSGNLLLFSVPMYAGAEAEYLKWFAYLSLLVSLPVFFYASLGFYKNAWASLKTRTLSIDLPITIALISGFGFSTMNLIKGHLEYIYYDSIASFVFLILSARYVLSRLQQHFVSTYTESDFKITDQVVLEKTGRPVSKESLRVGDRFLLKKGQTLPTEARLLTNSAEISLAYMTGESEPRVVHKGMEILSGAQLISEEVFLEVTKEYKESQVAYIKDQLSLLKDTKAPVLDISDRFSQYFIATVFLVASVFFVIYSRIDAFEAFQRAFAVLIVACPCALALGTPLAYVMGAYRAKKNGILVFRKDLFDRVLAIRSVFFDKTGTLTHGTLSLQKVEPTDEGLINILLNLEKNSQHPVAFALRKKYIHLYSELPIEPQEILGQGVEGEWNGDHYRFVKGDSVSGESSSVLYKNGNPIMEVAFEDLLRGDSRESVLQLKKTFSDIALLTGDGAFMSQKIAKEVGIDQIYYEYSPQMKLEKIKSHQPALMIGDGVNDAMAIQSAHVGIAVQGSVQVSADHCDAYFLKSGVSQLIRLYKISRDVRRTVWTNLTISLIYNVGAAALALMGFIGPLAAAVLMPISSFVILANTVRGVR